MAAMNERYDSALLGVLQSEGQIAKFLDTIFGFLYRKTDFYLTMKDKTAKMGFPPGIALKLTVGAFKKYEELAKFDEQRRNAAKESEQKAPTASASGKKVEVARSPQPEVTSAKEVSAKSPVESVVREQPNVNSARSESIALGAEKCAAAVANEAVEKPIPSPAQEKAKSASGGGGEEEDEVDPALTEMQKKFQANPESYNGAARDNYSWSQSIGDVDVHVKVPATVRKGADVKVAIEKKKLKVAYKDDSGQFVTTVDGALTWEIVKDESMWTLSPGEHVHVNLEKHQERWWEALLGDEPKISVRKIDPSRPITDLDEEAQAKIEEMMFNEHQKRLGKPQTHEAKVHDMLKKAWDADGSPFKGQPFDPSVVKVANQGSMQFPGT